MKKRIIIGLTIFSLIFFLGGIYIILTIEKTTSTLDNLIRLHQIEIIRGQLLIDVKQVQSDLASEKYPICQGTGYGRFQCDPHEERIQQLSRNAITPGRFWRRIKDMIDQIQLYQESLSRILTFRAGIERVQAEEDEAYRLGQELIDRLRHHDLPDQSQTR